MYRLFALAALLVVSSAATAQVTSACPSARSSQPLEQANTELVRRFHDAINRQDWVAADNMVSSDYRHFITTAGGFRAISWEAFKRGNQRLRSAFPDWRNTFLQTIAERDRVAVVLQGTGTHRGSIAGERATGRTATLPLMIVHQICRGKLVADWEMVNITPLLEALNAP